MEVLAWHPSCLSECALCSTCQATCPLSEYLNLGLTNKGRAYHGEERWCNLCRPFISQIPNSYVQQEDKQQIALLCHVPHIQVYYRRYLKNKCSVDRITDHFFYMTYDLAKFQSIHYSVFMDDASFSGVATCRHGHTMAHARSYSSVCPGNLEYWAPPFSIFDGGVARELFSWNQAHSSQFIARSTTYLSQHSAENECKSLSEGQWWMSCTKKKFFWRSLPFRAHGLG